jgi:mono/diheme cytochrome c family protein
MSINLNTDVSKQRFALTKDYKKFKEAPFDYKAEKGKALFMDLCARCHNKDGSGSYKFPPLKNSKIVLNEQLKFIKIVLFGLRGEIVRDSKKFNSVMPGFKNLSHDDLAHVLTYVKTSINGTTKQVPPIEVIKAKVDFILQRGPYTEDKL